MARCLVVGLGNPGKEYESTRHSVGFYIVDALAAKNGLRWETDRRHCAQLAKCPDGVILAKPTTFMNESGTAVAFLSRYYRIPTERLVVIYDDIAFPVGDFRINDREGTGGHNGVADILAKIGGGFARYRIGVGGKPDRRMDLVDHVLSKFSADELSLLNSKIPEILEYLQLLLDKGAEHAMNLANRKKVL
ncbi:MAG: aminoacyl-tRNA hydrolase [Puniceicoccales bacterium]|jgi:PTH1 family peptidyl-tRNA hydrolase|nr:aminoacyl-tRNA hydrolase [Puniceicoccales bacterium]